MKKNSPNTDKEKLNPLKDTRNYAAGQEGEDIIEREDEESDSYRIEDEPLDEELVLSEDELDDETYDDDDEEDDDDRA